MKSIIDLAKEYAISLYSERNLRYGNEPYSNHLQEVVDIATQFKHLLSSDDIEDVIAACWLHDCVEDCGVSYSDIQRMFGRRVADIVYDVTNELGKNRKERALRTYVKTMHNPLAIFVKCCDRLANMRRSKTEKESMYKKYCQEFPVFKYALKSNGQFSSLWDELEQI